MSQRGKDSVNLKRSFAFNNLLDWGSVAGGSIVGGRFWPSTPRQGCCRPTNINLVLRNAFILGPFNSILG